MNQGGGTELGNERPLRGGQGTSRETSPGSSVKKSQGKLPGKKKLIKGMLTVKVTLFFQRFFFLSS